MRRTIKSMAVVGCLGAIGFVALSCRCLGAETATAEEFTIIKLPGKLQTYAWTCIRAEIRW